MTKNSMKCDKNSVYCCLLEISKLASKISVFDSNRIAVLSHLKKYLFVTFKMQVSNFQCFNIESNVTNSIAKHIYNIYLIYNIID